MLNNHNTINEKAVLKESILKHQNENFSRIPKNLVTQDKSPLLSDIAQGSTTQKENEKSSTNRKREIKIKEKYNKQKKPGIKKIEIMLISNNPKKTEAIKQTLTKTCCGLSHVASECEALLMIKTTAPDLLIWALSEPNPSALDKIKRHYEDIFNQEIPTILIIENKIVQERKQEIASANDYVLSPFNEGEFLIRIKIQIDLIIQNQRMLKLFAFLQELHRITRLKESVKSLIRLLESDPLILGCGLFYKRNLQAPNSLGLPSLNYPIELKEKKEATFIVSKNVLQFYQISNDYCIVARFPKHSSETWLKTLIAQLRYNNVTAYQMETRPNEELINKFITPHLNDLLFIKVEKNYCLVFIQASKDIKEKLVRIPFKHLLSALDKTQLFQVHRSYAVNPSKMLAASALKQEVYLPNSIKVPIAKKYISRLKHLFPEQFKMSFKHS